MRLLLVATGLLLAGCGNAFIVTDSFTPPPQGLDSAPDSLHEYAVGTVFGLDVRASRMFVDMNVVKVVAKNPDLLTVDDQKLEDGVIHATLHALAAGTAGLDFVDDHNRPLEERVIEVKQPDEIDLAVDIDTDHGYTIPALDGDNMLVAAGGKVTFRVSYKAGGGEVKGKGVLVGASDTFTVQNPTKDGPDRELVKLLAPAQPGEVVPVDLSVADQVVRTLQVRAASPDEIATIQLDEGELPSWKSNGDVYTVWGKAFTEDAAPVFGAPLAWTFDSATVDGDGDLLSYTYQGGERRRIQVRAGDAVEDLTVEAKDGTALVGTTQSAGCAAVPGAPPALALLLLGLARLRRRGERLGAPSRVTLRSEARRGTLPSSPGRGAPGCASAPRTSSRGSRDPRGLRGA